MSLVLTLFMLQNTLVSEVHSRTETHLHVFTCCETTIYWARKPTISGRENKVRICKLEERVIFNSPKKSEGCHPIVTVLLKAGRPPPHTT